jgi:DNA/RNA endonuclease G (NUC1)
MYAVIVPNRGGPGARLQDYAVAVDEVEKRTGLDFFRELDDDL